MAETHHASQTISPEKLREYSEYFANKFLVRSICCQPLLSDIADFSFYPTEAAYKAESKRCIAGPIYTEKEQNGCRIHLCEQCLQGIPTIALQGWLEQELTVCRQENREVFYCNFRLNILPLFFVVGSAENVIRELVHYLETGLRQYLATQKLIHLGLGLHQVYFQYFKLDPGKLTKERYQLSIPHGWMRAHFLARKLKAYMPISLLKMHQIEFAENLESAWWRYHEYLLPEDRELVKTIADIPALHSDLSYCDNVIRIFKKVRDALLISKTSVQQSQALH